MINLVTKPLKNLTLFLLFLFAVHLSDAQEKDTSSFTADDNSQAIATYDLQGCIQFALKNSESLNKANYQVQISEKEIKERLSAGYPKLTLRANLTYNYKIQQSVLDKEAPAYAIFAADIPDPKPDFITFAFGLPYAGNMIFDLEQLVFDFSYLIGIKAARSYADLFKKQVKQNQIEIASNVTKAYYAVLINKERLDLLDANFLRLDTIYDNTAAMYKNGMAEKIDVMRTEVSLNNLKTEREKLVQIQKLTLQLLKFQMGMSVNDSLSLQGNIRELNLDMVNIIVEDGSYQNRIEYDILQMNKRLQEINLQYNKSLYLPRLTASANYGSLTNSTKFENVWKFRERWFDYGAIGLNLTVPILDGFKKKHTLAKSKLEILKVEEDIKQFKRSVDLEIVQAKSNLITYSKDLEIQKKNMELAQEVARVSRVKYENGVGSTLEIVDAEASFKEAENNYYTALYNIVISKVDLDKATGKLKMN